MGGDDRIARAKAASREARAPTPWSRLSETIGAPIAYCG